MTIFQKVISYTESGIAPQLVIGIAYFKLQAPIATKISEAVNFQAH